MTSPLLRKAAREGREIVGVTPEQAGWKHVGFRALRLAAAERDEVAEPVDRVGRTSPVLCQDDGGKDGRRQSDQQADEKHRGTPFLRTAG